MIFKSPMYRRKMNKATHLPILLGIAKEVLSHWIRFKPLVVIDMPLLFETGFFHVTAPYNVLISCSSSTQLRRLMARDGLGREEAESRMEAQMPLALKENRANYIICNDNVTFEELGNDVKKVINGIRKDSRVQGLVTSPLGVVVGILLLLRFVK